MTSNQQEPIQLAQCPFCDGTMIVRSFVLQHEKTSQGVCPISMMSWSASRDNVARWNRRAPAAMELQVQASIDVLKERRRQLESEGWTLAHDDNHKAGELGLAGTAYAFAATYPHIDQPGPMLTPPSFWPWDPIWWKPRSIRQSLVKAAALLIAEIERMDRAALTKGGDDGEH